MDERESHALAILEQKPEFYEESYRDLRYSIDPVDALERCKGLFQQNEKGYHATRYELVATVYANGLRLLSDKDAQDRFLKQDYFQRAWCWHVRTPRDLFRELFKYLTDEGNKTASKYGKVLWHL